MLDCGIPANDRKLCWKNFYSVGYPELENGCPVYFNHFGHCTHCQQLSCFCALKFQSNQCFKRFISCSPKWSYLASIYGRFSILSFDCLDCRNDDRICAVETYARKGPWL